MSIAPAAPYRPNPRTSTPPIAPSAPVRPTVAVRSMLRTVERVLLRDGGQRGSLVNARAAVLEGEQRAALRADARESLERLAGVSE